MYRHIDIQRLSDHYQTHYAIKGLVVMNTERQINLKEGLNQFAQLVNNNQAVKTLLNDWEPALLLEETDSGEKYYLQVRHCRVDEVGVGDIDAPDKIVIRGDRMTLLRRFSLAVYTLHRRTREVS
jgi:hypothetical protein